LDHGQSYWLDNLTRGMIDSGALEQRVRQEGLRGVTSNPSIFQKAITGGTEYDEQIVELMDRRLPVNRIYERLVVDDIRDACDVLRPVYDESGGTDGFVSLEVSPYLAHDTEGSVEEALRLYEAVDRPNVFIKIPGTDAGVPAIEELLYRGVNVNITLLFSIDAYEAVARAYLRAMERRREEGKSLEDVASVASFFLSRIDVLVDNVLGHRIQSGAAGDEVSRLMGRAGIANAKLAYRRFQELFSGDRWETLEDAGAHVQRMLWASTSTKDPLYSDIRYVEPLIGPHTVNTLPERTIRAFDDHGTVATTVEEGMDEARRVMERLSEVGIDFEHVTEQLLHEGVRKFIDPYDSLMATLAERYERHAGWPSAGHAAVLGDGEGDVEESLDSLERRQFARRLDEPDPALWSDDPEVRKAISNRLGWLELPDSFADRLDEIHAFADDVRPPEFEDVLLLGMGGSCQAARVLEGVFGADGGRPGLTVLDDTSPEAVRETERRLDLESTLVIVASKSGATVETRALYRHFRSRIGELVDASDAGDRFVAITDPGTPLAREAEERGFRALFENPEDVGGRYSALSFFGLVPAALLGIDVEALLRRAGDLRRWHDGSVPSGANPAVRLGATLGALAGDGRDKVTVVASDELEPFPLWLEQLLAESTGKEGRGLVPVVGEELEGPEAYGDDRVFVRLHTRESQDLDAARRLENLQKAGHPVLEIQLRERADLGAEFLRWEIAVATAGRILGVNPFDEPDVRSSKEATADLLEHLADEGQLPGEKPVARGEQLELYADREAAWFGSVSGGGPDRILGAILESVEAGDYLSLLSFFRPTSERRAALQTLRSRLRDRLGVATSLSHGPGYLHSTGQLHKGGPNRGVFLMLTADPGEPLDVPGEPYGFGDLRAAQALGDERALRERGRRVLRLHLGSDVEAGLRELYERLVPEGEETARAAGTPVSSSA
nr:bifunctional transaldolase/phosoglucose isomerase [Candidatus Palauibacterales bacterium]